ncbi:hypothetical protein [Rufibacter hautae]|uniref:Lipocalin-like domain-containing protein n=1 Tax=Rufibacter hautae TaxID=2595005 RepID=A0A5B6TBX9_9BACT|nr:hypothetical protein [Rufibacter hautae]KAA3436461.1 hypothetical protein FOA19_18905 [Rufibacter hautae]
MRRLLSLLLVFLVVFSGCSSDDEADVLTVAEAEALLQGKWLLTSGSQDTFLDNGSFVRSEQLSLEDPEYLSFSGGNVQVEIFDKEDSSRRLYNLSEGFVIASNAGKITLRFNQNDYEVLVLSQEQLRLRIEFDNGGEYLLKNYNFTKTK